MTWLLLLLALAAPATRAGVGVRPARCLGPVASDIESPSCLPAVQLPLRGYLDGDPSDATITRATSAWCADASGQYYEAFAGEACFAGGTGWTNNYLPNSKAVSAWAATRATTVADSTTAPDGTTTADTLSEDGTAASTHYLTQSYTSPPFGATTAAIYAKASNRTWATWQPSPTSYATFGLSPCSVGVTSGSLSYTVIDAGDGWCKLVAEGVLVSTYSRIYAAEADNDTIFDGLSQDSLYAWGAQVSPGTDPPACLCEGAAACRCGVSGTGISIHAAVTNYVGDSLDASAQVAAGTPTITTDTASGPFATYNGGAEADTIEDDSALSREGIESASAGTATGDYTISAWMAEGTTGYYTLQLRVDGANVGLCSGTVGASFERVTCTKNVAVAAVTDITAMALVGLVGSDVGSVEISHFQLEKSSLAGRPCVCTTGASCTCNGDVVTQPSAGWPAEAGKITLDYTPSYSGAGSNRALVEARDGATRGWLLYITGSGGLTWFSKSGAGAGSSFSSPIVGSLVAGSTIRLGVAWDAAGLVELFVEGSSIGAWSGADVADGIASTVGIGAYDIGLEQVDGEISNLQVYRQ